MSGKARETRVSCSLRVVAGYMPKWETAVADLRNIVVRRSGWLPQIAVQPRGAGAAICVGAADHPTSFIAAIVAHADLTSRAINTQARYVVKGSRPVTSCAVNRYWMKVFASRLSATGYPGCIRQRCGLLDRQCTRCAMLDLGSADCRGE